MPHGRRLFNHSRLPFSTKFITFQRHVRFCLDISDLSPTRLPHCHACILILIVLWMSWWVFLCPHSFSVFTVSGNAPFGLLIILPVARLWASRVWMIYCTCWFVVIMQCNFQINGHCHITTNLWLCPSWTEHSAARFHVDLLGTVFWIRITVYSSLWFTGSMLSIAIVSPHDDNE